MRILSGKVMIASVCLIAAGMIFVVMAYTAPEVATASKPQLLLPELQCTMTQVIEYHNTNWPCTGPMYTAEGTCNNGKKYAITMNCDGTEAGRHELKNNGGGNPVSPITHLPTLYNQVNWASTASPGTNIGPSGIDYNGDTVFVYMPSDIVPQEVVDAVYQHYLSLH